MEQYGKLLSMQQAINGSRLANLQIKQAQTQLDQQDKLRALLPQARNDDGTINYAKLEGLQAGVGDVSGALTTATSRAKLESDLAARKLTETKATGADLDNHVKATGQIASLLGNVNDQASYEAAIREGAASDNPLVAQAAKAFYVQNPQYNADAIKGALDRTMSHKDQLELRAKNANQPFNENGTPNTAVQKFLMDKAAARASKTNINLPGNGLKGIQDVQAKELEEGGKSARAAADTLASINHMREAASGSMYAGAGANVKAGIADFLANGLGLNIDRTKMTNTREFTSAAGAQLLAHAKTLGANPSNADATRIEKIIGSADTDPQAMQKVMDWAEEMARKAIARHNQRIDQVEQYARDNKEPNPFAFDMRVQAPEPYQGKTPQPGDMIRVITPDGKAGTIDRAHLDDLLKSGGKVAE